MYRIDNKRMARDVPGGACGGTTRTINANHIQVSLDGGFRSTSLRCVRPGTELAAIPVQWDARPRAKERSGKSLNIKNELNLANILSDSDNINMWMSDTFRALTSQQYHQGRLHEKCRQLASEFCSDLSELAFD